MTDHAPLVRCTDAGRVFGTGEQAVVALHDAACEIDAGDCVAMTGPSGSGKTTLLHLMAGLDTPTSGSVTWPAIGPGTRVRPGPIGVVFQSPRLLPPLDVLENVALPRLLAGGREPDANAAAMALLDRLGLAGLATKLPEELSGGQAQRVAVARALVTEPRLVLADEPTGQLDHDAGAMVLDTLFEARRDTGVAVLVSTHDPVVARRFDTRWTIADGVLDTHDRAVTGTPDRQGSWSV